MRTKRKMTWAAAGLLAAALVVAGSVYATQDDPLLVNTNELDSRSLLLRPDERPAGQIIEMSLAEAGQTRLAPEGMVWSPASCSTYLEQAIPDLYSLDGWVQQTDRRAADFKQDDYFVAMTINVPGGPDLDSIRAAAETCRAGKLTLDSTVTGTVSYTKSTQAPLSNGDSLELQVGITFGEPETERQAAVMSSYGYIIGTIIHWVIIAVAGDTLLYSMSPAVGTAQDIAATLYERATGAGVG